MPTTAVCLPSNFFFFLITAGIYLGCFPTYLFITLGVPSFPLLRASLTCSESLTLCSRELTLMAASLILGWIPSGQNLIDWISRERAGSLSVSLLQHHCFSSWFRSQVWAVMIVEGEQAVNQRVQAVFWSISWFVSSFGDVFALSVLALCKYSCQ